MPNAQLFHVQHFTKLKKSEKYRTYNKYQENRRNKKMAKHNHVSMLGVIQRKPQVVVQDGEYKQAIAFLRITRGPREVGDNRYAVKYDYPVMISRDPKMIEQIDQWIVGDVILVKGVIATTTIRKKSTCTNEECGEANFFEGLMVYINPIHLLKVAHFDTDEEAMRFIQENGEISNQVQVIGTLVRDPKKITPKTGLIVTQYQIALNRKYKIPTDPPEIKSDYPWVKVYGENAIADKKRLHTGSEIYIDGCIQARRINRKSVCAACGEEYTWCETAMELVPFSTEYLNEFYSDEEIEQHEQERLDQIKRDIFRRDEAKKMDISSLIPDDVVTQEDIESGMDVDNMV